MTDHENPFPSDEEIRFMTDLSRKMLAIEFGMPLDDLRSLMSNVLISADRSLLAVKKSRALPFPIPVHPALSVVKTILELGLWSFSEFWTFDVECSMFGPYSGYPVIYVCN
jgi:hypothetical protein